MLTPIQTITLEWFCSLVAVPFVLARFWVRGTLSQYQFWVSDVLLVIGLGCSIGLSMCYTLIYQKGALQNYQSTSEYLGKIRFTERLLFDTGLYFPKLSLVLSYAKMVPETSPRLRLFLRCIALYVGFGCVFAIASDTFWCGPNPSVNWTDPRTCSSFTNEHLQGVTWTINVVGVLLLLVFPFLIVRSLRFTHFREKVAFAVLLALGIITIIFSTLRFLFMVFLVDDNFLAVWRTAETSISVIVVAAMAMRPLLRRVGHGMNSGITKVTSRTWESTKSDAPRAHQQHPDEEDPDGLAMPEPTEMWYMWPVDLDLNKMSVTTTTDTVGMGIQETESSTQRSSSAARMSRSVLTPACESHVMVTQAEKEEDNTIS